MRPKMLDLFSCAGGAGVGYMLAGFDVTGVDNVHQPNHPAFWPENDGSFQFVNADALEYVAEHGHEYDAIHASPPCQAYSRTRTLHTNSHPDLIAQTRSALADTGKPYIIENVEGAPLIKPLILCGTMFRMTANDVDGALLRLVRHRLFESNVKLTAPGPCNHKAPGITASVYGAGGGWTPKHRDNPERRGGYIPAKPVLEELLGVWWTTKHELSQVVPPVFTGWLGAQLRTRIEVPA